MQYYVLQMIIKLTSLAFVLKLKNLEYSYILYLWIYAIWINLLKQGYKIECKCCYADPYFAPNSIPNHHTFPYLHFMFICI
jgi:hypothetical protein